MIKPAPQSPRGIAGLAFLFCAVALVIGFGLDLLANGARFSVAAQPGGRAVLGIGVAAVVVLAAQGLRFLLGRKLKDTGGDNAIDHP